MSYFFHISHLVNYNEHTQTIDIGDACKFNTELSPKGLRATNVVLMKYED